jgi:hypothetical protein
MTLKSPTARRLLAVLALSALAAGATGTAHADWHDHYGDRRWHEREWREHHRHYYGERVYVAPPPTVYYAPPPPPPGLSFGFRVR